jgi:hypothetical protein
MLRFKIQLLSSVFPLSSTLNCRSSVAAEDMAWEPTTFTHTMANVLHSAFVNSTLDITFHREKLQVYASIPGASRLPCRPVVYAVLCTGRAPLDYLRDFQMFRERRATIAAGAPDRIAVSSDGTAYAAKFLIKSQFRRRPERNINKKTQQF